MKRLVSDTVFTRLFGLVVASLLVSHLVSTLLFVVFAGEHRMPPPEMRQTVASMADGKQPVCRPPHRGERPPLPPNFWYAQLLQLICVTLLAWYGARRLVRPIHELTHAASRLGDNLEAPPIAETGPAETRQAARLFNQMQDKIRLQLAERSRFLAAVSHDLRTPLTRIRLRSVQMDNAELQNKLVKDIDEMAAMLDATLAYLRDESQQESWQMLDITALLQVLAEDAQELGHAVSIDGEADSLYTLPSSLRRCLDNLLENALRYGEKADITLRQDKDSICIEIRDHGPGIPESRLASVFEPFVRLEESRNRHTGGVGLGLAIARDAARRMGGTLSLHNVPQGGLLARLTLPRDMRKPLYQD